MRCGSSTDAVCSTTSQTSEIVESVPSVAGVVIFLIAIFRWNVIRKRGAVSRRLMEIPSEDFVPGKTAVDQQDLPWSLRLRYKARGVLGRGAFGVVLEALDIRANSLVAIKLVFPVGRQFTNEELQRLLLEVQISRKNSISYLLFDYNFFFSYRLEYWEKIAPEILLSTKAMVILMQGTYFGL